MGEIWYLFDKLPILIIQNMILLDEKTCDPKNDTVGQNST